MAARDGVTTAGKELADAQAALAEAKGSSPKPAPTSKATKLVPSAPPASLARVEQAEEELDSAVEGINDETPFVRASQQLNAAAVALEMAWLGLLSDVGCLTDEQQATVGYYTATVDGVYGPATVDAVETLQKSHDLPVTGAMDAATSAALESELADLGGAAAEQSVATAAAVQQTLSLAGFWSGPIDGEWTPALTEALEAFQTELGVEPSGVVDAATVAALEHAIADLAAEPAPTEDSTPSPTDSPSS